MKVHAYGDRVFCTSLTVDLKLPIAPLVGTLSRAGLIRTVLRILEWN